MCGCEVRKSASTSNAPAIVRHNIRRRQIQFVHVSRRPTAYSSASAITRFLLTRFAATLPSGNSSTLVHFFIQPHRHAVIPQVIHQRFHHFRVRELQQPRPLLHDNHAHAQRGEHARYSTPITPPPTTISVFGICGICRIWSLLMMVRPLIGTLAITAGFVSRGDHDVFRVDNLRLPARFCTRIVCGVLKLPVREQLDAVARNLGLGHVDSF